MVDDVEISYDEALERAILLIRSKWAASVLLTLAGGSHHVMDLLREINDNRVQRRERLSYKVMNDTLKSLVDAGLISKHRETVGFATRSWCELTPHGRALLQASRPLVAWYHIYSAARIAGDPGGDQPATA